MQNATVVKIVDYYPDYDNSPMAKLDLEPSLVKLMDTDEGEGWSLEDARTIETWYKWFLYLNAVYQDRSIVPTKAIDTFWHYHILDMEKYEEDCQTVFGYFLHHFPYFRPRLAVVV